MARKVVQVAVYERVDKLIAVCDDGTLWLGNSAQATGVAWQQMTAPPDPQPGPGGIGTRPPV